MGSEEAAVAGPTPRSRDRLQFALVFLISMTFALLSSSRFSRSLLYGAPVAQNFAQADSSYLTWLRMSLAFAFLLVFYQLGKRINFRNRYLQLGLLSFAGVLVGGLPQLIGLQTTSPNSSSIAEFTLSTDLASIIQFA
jgi:hypothetical protein